MLEEPDVDDIERNEAMNEIKRRLESGESYTSIAKNAKVSMREIAKVSKSIKAGM